MVKENEWNSIKIRNQNKRPRRLAKRDDKGEGEKYIQVYRRKRTSYRLFNWRNNANAKYLPFLTVMYAISSNTTIIVRSSVIPIKLTHTSRVSPSSTSSGISSPWCSRGAPSTLTGSFGWFEFVSRSSILGDVTSMIVTQSSSRVYPQQMQHRDV